MNIRYFVLIPLITLTAACSRTDAQTIDTTQPNEEAVEESKAQSWAFDDAASELTFTATQNGKSFSGSFQSFNADIHFDPEDLGNSSIVVTIEMDSAKTGDRQRDSALPGSDWFKTKNFPKATFKTTAISDAGENNFEAIGNLTIRDVTKEIVLPFTYSSSGNTSNATGAITLVRTDFGIGQGEFSDGKWVGLDVSVAFDVTATR